MKKYSIQQEIGPTSSAHNEAEVAKFLNEPFDKTMIERLLDSKHFAVRAVGVIGVVAYANTFGLIENKMRIRDN